MAISTNVNKTIAIKKQTGLNAKAPAGVAGTAQLLRRVSSEMNAKKANFKSQEVLPSQQIRDFRHGKKSIEGKLSGELSSGTYQKLFESLLRAAAAVAATSGALVTVTAAVTSGAQGTFTRSAGSWLTDGFRVGKVIRFTGWTTTAIANNNHNFLILSLTATVMTVVALDGVPIVAKAAGDSVTALEAGKTVSCPATGQTRDYYTIEHFFTDIAQSEQFTDCVFSQASVKVPPNGMATVEFTVMGIDMQTEIAQYFTSPATPTSSNVTAGANGVVIVNGVVYAIITNFDLTINGNYQSPGGVVGSNLEPDILPGVLEVSGQMTVLFQDAVLRDAFLAETEGSVQVALTANNSPNSDFISFFLPRTKLGGADKDDAATGLLQTLPFQALENVSDASEPLSTIAIQDSLFA